MRRVQSIITKHALVNKPSQSVFQAQRYYATLNVRESKVAQFNKFGSASDVVKIENVPLPSSLAADEVLIKFLAAPINPADINTIQGTYGKAPSTFPAVGGSEGVAVIQQVGNSVSQLKINQRVIPAKPGMGTWRTHAVVKASDLQTVSEEIPVEYAAVIAVNPCTAYRLLKDFVELKSGDVIVQNGANSMVGLSVIQIAKARGIKTINIIRDRPGSEQVISQLKDLGADIVVTETYANSANMKKLIADMPKPKLALNCVGGKSGRAAARHLADQGTMVTYGGMSCEPVTVPTSPFIFNDITLRGFWLTRWVENNTKESRQKMLDEIAELIKQKKLVLFTETFKFADFGGAIEASQTSKRSRKTVLKME